MCILILQGVTPQHIKEIGAHIILPYLYYQEYLHVGDGISKHQIYLMMYGLQQTEILQRTEKMQ